MFSIGGGAPADNLDDAQSERLAAETQRNEAKARTARLIAMLQSKATVTAHEPAAPAQPAAQAVEEKPDVLAFVQAAADTADWYKASEHVGVKAAAEKEAAEKAAAKKAAAVAAAAKAHAAEDEAARMKRIEDAEKEKEAAFIQEAFERRAADMAANEAASKKLADEQNDAIAAEFAAEKAATEKAATDKAGAKKATTEEGAAEKAAADKAATEKASAKKAAVEKAAVAQKAVPEAVPVNNKKVSLHDEEGSPAASDAPRVVEAKAILVSDQAAVPEAAPSMWGRVMGFFGF